MRNRRASYAARLHVLFWSVGLIAETALKQIEALNHNARHSDAKAMIDEWVVK
jgi:hypothetical protein